MEINGNKCKSIEKVIQLTNHLINWHSICVKTNGLRHKQTLKRNNSFAIYINVWINRFCVQSFD